MKPIFSAMVAAVKVVLTLFVIMQMAGLGFAVYKAKPSLVALSTGHLTIKRRIRLDVDTRLPITSAIHTTLEIPIKKKITLNLPIRGDIQVAIDEPFEIPVSAPVQVALDHAFRINKEITVNAPLTIDQEVETTLLGFDTTLPIRGEIPVTMAVGLDEMVPINDTFPLHITEPLICQVSHDLTIPIDIMAKSQFLIDQTIPVPVNVDISTGIRLTGGLACFLYIDLSWDRQQGLVIDHWVKVE